MSSFYEDHCNEYFQATAHLDPSPFLTPLAKRLAPGATILDVGCGSGRDLRWLADHGFKPTGFEQAPKLAKMAKTFCQQNIIEGNFSSYDFSTLKFDAILLIGALVHLQPEDLPTVLLHICEALHENGLVNLSMKEGSGQQISTDGRIFTLWGPQDLESIFTEIGFQVLDFSRFTSALNDQDVWLNYILTR